MTNEIRAEIVQFLPRLRRFAHALTGSLDSGDDLVQETCMRALSRVEQYQPGMRLDSWMFKIAKNIWIDQARRQKVRGNVIQFDEAALAGSSDGRMVTEDRLTLDAVARAISELPPDLQVLISLICIDGRSYRETADVVGIPIGTVMSRLARARRTLHDVIGREIASEPKAKGAPHG